MKASIQAELTRVVRQLAQEHGIADAASLVPALERTRDPQHGDFATNVAMVLAKAFRQPPRALAERILQAMQRATAGLRDIQIAGPGFINFFIEDQAYLSNLRELIRLGPAYGRSMSGARQRVQVEFVSANPTGPLHVGHGRGAAYGSVVADLLEAVGYQVHREYYVNDAGRQMDILATSVWLRYLELCGEELPFPSNGYRGDYVWDIAATLHREHGEHYLHAAAEVFKDAPADARYDAEGQLLDGDKELHIDALIQQAKTLLGDHRYRFVFELGLNTILEDIRDDLGLFGVRYDEWYSEQGLTTKGAVNHALERLRTGGYLYEKEGATWFRSTAFGDEKDRVVIRENGQITYFASDIAYHHEKFLRGFDRVIDIWGADHHGYVPRVRAALQALGVDASRLDVLLVQFAILYRDGKRVQMSTRSGEFVTLRQLRKDVGSDAARYFYVQRKCEQHLDFDLDLAKSQSNDNPVYYLQYAHARICSVLRQAAERFPQDDFNPDHGPWSLDEPVEKDMLRALAHYPDAVDNAARQLEPHLLCHELIQLATLFHNYYNHLPFLVADDALRRSRLALILGIRQVLRNGLNLLGLSAPEQM